MAPEKKSNPAATWGKFFIGLLLMLGGAYVSQTWHPEFLKELEHQGIPLDLGMTVAVIGVFLMLFPVLDTFFFTPLGSAIHGRTSELERTFSEAEDLRAEMTKMRTEYEQRLVATEASAREQIQAQIREAQALRGQLMAEAAEKADQLVRKAQQEIEQEKKQLMTELRLEVVNLTLLATEKVIGENVDSERNRRLVQDFIDKVEVAS